jgi:hypothetical protein
MGLDWRHGLQGCLLAAQLPERGRTAQHLGRSLAVCGACWLLLRALHPGSPNPLYDLSACLLPQVDPELLATFDKLGIPLNEQKRLANVAVDAVFDSVSIATTFKEELGKVGFVLHGRMNGSPCVHVWLGAASNHVLAQHEDGVLGRWCVGASLRFRPEWAGGAGRQTCAPACHQLKQMV